MDFFFFSIICEEQRPSQNGHCFPAQEYDVIVHAWLIITRGKSRVLLAFTQEEFISVKCRSILCFFFFFFFKYDVSFYVRQLGESRARGLIGREDETN